MRNEKENSALELRPDHRIILQLWKRMLPVGTIVALVIIATLSVVHDYDLLSTLLIWTPLVLLSGSLVLVIGVLGMWFWHRHDLLIIREEDLYLHQDGMRRYIPWELIRGARPGSFGMRVKVGDGPERLALEFSFLSELQARRACTMIEAYRKPFSGPS